jgi:hypothetical protein
MAIIREGDLLEILACDISARPPAPGPGDLEPFIAAVVREPDAVVVSFDPAAADTFQAFAEAERQCCTDIGWDIVPGPALRITATPAQLDAIYSLFDSFAE